MSFFPFLLVVELIVALWAGLYEFLLKLFFYVGELPLLFKRASQRTRRNRRVRQLNQLLPIRRNTGIKEPMTDNIRQSLKGDVVCFCHIVMAKIKPLGGE